MTTQAEVETTPDYWLIVLMRSIRGSDLELAAEAQQRLREMGVDIKFGNLLREVPSCR